MLGAGLGDLDAVVISHLHADHAGGLRAVRRRAFAFAAGPLEPRGVPAFVPAPVCHPRAGIAVTAGPRVTGPGLAVLPPLPRMLFWTGYVTGQVLVVSVRGFGLVLVSGCGHPRTEPILAVTGQILDVPIRAMAGGLHLPVHAAGTRWCRRRSRAARIRPGSRSASGTPGTCGRRSRPAGRGSSPCPGTTGIPWTYHAFRRRLGDRYRTLRAGQEQRITAADR